MPDFTDPLRQNSGYQNKPHRIPTRWLSAIFVALPVLILAVYFGIRDVYYFNRPVNSLDYFILALSFFIGGLTGIVYIVRREFPQVVIMRGTLAVIFGMFITVLGWGIAMYSLVSAIRIMLG